MQRKVAILGKFSHLFGPWGVNEGESPKNERHILNSCIWTFHLIIPFFIVNSKRSDPEKILCRLPQGTVLDPLLFILYINDLVKVLKHSYINIFADDSKLIKVIKSLEDRDLLNTNLHAVIEWGVRNKMEFNKLKFQLMSYGKN